MTVKTTDLDKFDQIVTLLNGWVSDMDSLGVDLMGVRFQVRDNYYTNEFSYNKEALPAPYWEIV